MKPDVDFHRGKDPDTSGNLLFPLQASCFRCFLWDILCKLVCLKYPMALVCWNWNVNMISVHITQELRRSSSFSNGTLSTEKRELYEWWFRPRFWSWLKHGLLIPQQAKHIISRGIRKKQTGKYTSQTNKHTHTRTNKQHKDSALVRLYWAGDNLG